MKVWKLKFTSYRSKDDIFDMIVNGTKTIETRSRNPNDGDKDYSNIKVGDILEIKSTDSGRIIKKTVSFNHLYSSAEELAETEDVKKILPMITKKEQYLKVIDEVKEKWGEKYKFEVENYGMVAIGFK
jgi:ASC-1-like (ASCH) protein